MILKRTDNTVKMLHQLVIGPLWWLLKSLATYFSLVLILTILYRARKIFWARRAAMLPVQANEAVLITGATSGIGLALAKRLYKLGYSVLVGYYDARESGYDELKRLASSSKSNGKQQMIFIELDVRDQKSIERAYDECQLALKRHNLCLYALVNNAGLGSLQPFAWLQRQTIRNMVDTNLTGALLVTRQFLPKLAEHKRGRLLNVSSGLGLLPGPDYATYGLTKVAQIYLTKCLNMELGDKYGVKCVAVIPHNFIKNTNICSRNVNNNERAWDELNELERRLYKQDFDSQCQLAKSLEEATREHARLTAVGQQRRQRERSHEANLNPLSWLLQLASVLKGESQALTIEQSGALEGFEDALRLEHPPELIFAGDNVYNLLMGSLLLSLPVSCLGLLGKSVAQSLYR